MEWNYSPMDRAYYQRSDASPAPRIEQPSFSLQELGQTVPVKDESGRFKTVAQGVQAALRGGAGVIQLVGGPPHTNPMGGMRSIGREQRQALREVLLVNQATFAGIEMPTSSLTNLSGYDPQNRRLSEEMRQSNLNEIREAIQFVAELGGGGGVDAVSFEFQRPLFNMDKSKNPLLPSGKRMFEGPPDEELQENIRFVDPLTGQIYPVSIGQGEYLHRDPATFERIPETEQPKKWMWNDFKRFAEYNKKRQQAGIKIDPEQEATNPYDQFRLEKFVKDLNESRSEAERLRKLLKRDMSVQKEMQERIDMVDKSLESGTFEDPQTKQIRHHTPETRSAFENMRGETYNKISDVERSISANHAQLRQLQSKEAQQRELLNRLTRMEDVAKDKTWESYAEAGLAAMSETQRLGKFMKEPVYVGPEIGWTHSYGGHPQEFMEIIQQARKKMVDMLTNAKSAHYQKGMSRKKAEEFARLHIRGTFDTGHAGMWLQHFRPELPSDKRLKEFKKWYLNEVDRIVKADVVGSVQVVDSHGGEHAHLPAGQGILPVAEATAKFLKQRSPVHVISEGHAEEQIGEGRIRTQTWKALGKDLPPQFFTGEMNARPYSWSNIEQGYFGKGKSPRQMFGSYTPPFGEYRPWAGGDQPLGFE